MASAVYRPESVADSRTLLLVEDDELLRMVMAGLLRDAGVNVVEAATADAALAALEADLAVDMIFTDVRTPGRLDGIGLALAVQRDRPHVAVIVTSGDLAPTVARELPVFVPKPYDLDAVVALLLDRLEGVR